MGHDDLINVMQMGVVHAYAWSLLTYSHCCKIEHNTPWVFCIYLELLTCIVANIIQVNYPGSSSY